LKERLFIGEAWSVRQTFQIKEFRQKDNEQRCAEKDLFLSNQAGLLAEECKTKSRNKAPKVCYICNKTRHVSKDCRQM
jgi:hypothetical protein